VEDLSETCFPNGDEYRPHEVQMMMEQLWQSTLTRIRVYSTFMIKEALSAHWSTLGLKKKMSGVARLA
jgi:hypothetical protein